MEDPRENSAARRRGRVVCLKGTAETAQQRRINDCLNRRKEGFSALANEAFSPREVPSARRSLGAEGRPEA